MNIVVQIEHHKDAFPDDIQRDARKEAQYKANQGNRTVGKCIKTETVPSIIGHEDARKTMCIFETKPATT